jgi:hypothetical protein
VVFIGSFCGCVGNHGLFASGPLALTGTGCCFGITGTYAAPSLRRVNPIFGFWLLYNDARRMRPKSHSIVPYSQIAMNYAKAAVQMDHDDIGSDVRTLLDNL